MYRITIRFYEELNDFLPPAQRKKDIIHAFRGRRSVKDLVESFGVPHVEVDLVLVNGASVDFSYIVSDGDRISVYPEFETLDVGDVSRLRPEPLRDTRFVLDVHLGKLARAGSGSSGSTPITGKKGTTPSWPAFRAKRNACCSPGTGSS